MSVHYVPTEEYILLKLIFEPERKTELFLKREIRIELSADMNLAANEMELCRFKLKKGAILRTKYTDFFDRATEFDTVNTINGADFIELIAKASPVSFEGKIILT